MNETEKILSLERENMKLKEDNQILLKILSQMKTTLNRLIVHYMTTQDGGGII